ncbi:acyltransferase [Candidatus Aerophobetes bacterium]|nr:acyltransferase [Candidatus Aerophobetes bacterium]
MEEGKQEEIQGRTELQVFLRDTHSSGFKKYQDLIIGSSNLLYLIKYEILTGFLGPLPGALGFMLRGVFFKSLLGKVGSGVVFGRNITLRHPQKIYLGDNVIIDDYVVLDAKGENNKGIFIGSNVTIGRNCIISCKNGDLTVGDNVIIGSNSYVQSGRRVDIGKNVGIGAYCFIIGGGEHKISRTDIPMLAQGQIIKDITIEENAMIGTGTKIKGGVTIGKDAFIGAGAMVTKSIPEFSIAVGVPAKVVRKRK